MNVRTIPQTAVAIASALPGMFPGSIISNRLHVNTLRLALALPVSVVGITMDYSMLVH